MTGLFDISGKIAVVTGGSRGIGRMIAAAYVDGGARVYIASRKSGPLEETARNLNTRGECIPIQADLAKESECKRLAAEVARREAKVDILVNNAGVTWAAPLADFDDAAWDRVLSLNVKGVFHMTRFMRPLLDASATERDPARIINIGSVYGLMVPLFEVYSYSAAKAAVHHLTHHLAKQLAPFITVNAIAPGPFETKQLAETLRTHGDEILDSTLLKRIGEPDDMAGIAVYLASRAGSYVTGAVIPVDGGIAVAR